MLRRISVLTTSPLVVVSSAIALPSRSVNVKPTINTSSARAMQAVPEFGTKRRREQRRQDRELREKAALDALATSSALRPKRKRTPKCTVAPAMGSSSAIVHGHVVSISAELLRYSMRWSLTLVSEGLSLRPGRARGARGTALDTTQADGVKHAPIADMFEGLCGIIQGSMSSFSVPFSAVRGRREPRQTFGGGSKGIPGK